MVSCLALAGCAAPDVSGGPPRTIEVAPETLPPDGGQGSSIAAAPADTEQCSRVADAYLSATLLPLAGEKQGDSDRSSLRDSAAQLEDAADALPAEVRDGFLEAADRLRDSGEDLQPEELAEVTGSLAPVDTWLMQRCSTD